MAGKRSEKKKKGGLIPQSGKVSEKIQTRSAAIETEQNRDKNLNSSKGASDKLSVKLATTENKSRRETQSKPDDKVADKRKQPTPVKNAVNKTKSGAKNICDEGLDLTVSHDDISDNSLSSSDSSKNDVEEGRESSSSTEHSGNSNDSSTSEGEITEKNRKRTSRKRHTLEDLEDMLLNLKDDGFLDRVIEKKRKLSNKKGNIESEGTNVNNSQNKAILNSPSAETVFEKLPVHGPPPQMSALPEEVNFSSGNKFDSDESIDTLKEICDRLSLQNPHNSIADCNGAEVREPQPGTSSGCKGWTETLSTEKIRMCMEQQREREKAEAQANVEKMIREAELHKAEIYKPPGKSDFWFQVAMCKTRGDKVWLKQRLMRNFFCQTRMLSHL